MSSPQTTCCYSKAEATATSGVKGLAQATGWHV